MEALNFRGDLISRLYLPREYRENNSLVKLNSYATDNETVMLLHVILSQTYWQTFLDGLF